MSTVKAHIFDLDGHWGTSRFSEQSLEEIVTHIHFCAHPNEKNKGFGGIAPTNHWSLSLEINPTRSLRVDVTPVAPSAPGLVVLDIKNFNLTDRRVYSVSSAVPDGTTIENILQVIIQNNRDRYIFTPTGEGCRFWMKTFAMDLAGADLVSNDVASQAVSALRYYFSFPAGSGYIERPMEKGSFF